MDKKKLTHLDAAGQARMVDVGPKDQTDRWAVARGHVRMSAEAFQAGLEGDIKKGDLRMTAQLAGISGAKKTADLIPLCHPLLINNIKVDVEWDPELPGASIRAEVRTTGRTGVEMEALTAVAISALTVYDMIKGIDKGARIESIRLVEKHGGRSGDVVLESEPV
jgi:cyclic pyranopterin phosphate synthase